MTDVRVVMKAAGLKELLTCAELHQDMKARAERIAKAAGSLAGDYPFVKVHDDTITKGKGRAVARRRLAVVVLGKHSPGAKSRAAAILLAALDAGR